jgi:hypothetical protein
MQTYDIVNYFSKGAVGFGLYTLYDVYVEDKSFTGFAMRDGLSFSLSIVATEWLIDVLKNMWDMNGNSVSGMITRPLLTSIIYMYLFNYMVRPEYETSRDNTNLLLMGGLTSVLLNYVNSPILSVFGLKSY